MNEASESLLSKKELLQITGISYGQLYRWKRQNLIPETWFIKQSSYTGQETFFPKDKILKRVQMIMDLKDQYSLEELADLLSPSSTNKLYQSSELYLVPGFDREIISKFQQALEQDSFAFRELVFMYLVGLVAEKRSLSARELDVMVESVKLWLPKLKNLSYVLVIAQREEQSFGLLVQQQTSYLLDSNTRQLESYDLEELAKDLNLRLNKVVEERQ